MIESIKFHEKPREKRRGDDVTSSFRTFFHRLRALAELSI